MSSPMVGDDAMTESFCATLECELIGRAVIQKAKMAIFDFTETFSNTWRRHSSIGNLASRVREDVARRAIPCQASFDQTVGW
jgi:hypothetical protein